MNKLLILILILLSWSLQAQPDLKSCIDSARIRYPLLKQAEVHAQILQEELGQIKGSNLPQVSLSGRLSWQSQVTELPIKLPGIEIPSLSQDQYKVQLEIEQAIYKGGVDQARKALAQADKSINEKQLEVEFQQIKNKVVALYFQTLLSKNSLKILATQEDMLKEKMQDVNALFEAGMVLSGAKDAIQAELISLEERRIDLEFQKKSMLEQLSYLSGFSTEQLQSIKEPEETLSASETHQRAEYQLMSSNIEKIEAIQGIQKSALRPKAFAFGNLGYGRPGLNMLSNDFEPYAMVGVGFQWKLWDWNQQRKQVQIHQLQIEAIRLQQRNFDFNLHTQLLSLQNEINKQEQLMSRSRELLPLRKRIMDQTEEQYKTGSVTPSAFLEEVKHYEHARLKLENNKLMLALAKVNYLLALGQI